MAAQQLRK